MIQRIDVELPGDTTAPRVARGLVDRFAGMLPDDKARTDLHLLVSEVVTNGLRHGKQGAPIRFGVWVNSEAVRVEVDNASSGGVPEQRAPGARQGGGGFGLFLLESLARRWGYETGDRTLVWFEFAAAGAPPERLREEPALELIKRWVEAVSAGDIATMLSLCDPDIHLEALTTRGVLHGHNEVRRWMEELRRTRTTIRATVSGLTLHDGPVAMAEGRLWLVEDAGLTDTPIYWIALIQNGKLLRGRATQTLALAEQTAERFLAETRL